MACFLAVFLSLSVLLKPASSQAATCDQFNVCNNGDCELQANQQLGCTCYPGFILDPANPLYCSPIPSCNLLPGTPDQQCLNGMCQAMTSGAYGCVCYQGYQLSSVNSNICENVDECTLPGTGCAPGACTDVIGDYSCTACMGGYTLLAQSGKCQRITARPPYQGNQVQAGQNNANSLMMFSLFDMF